MVASCELASKEMEQNAKLLQEVIKAVSTFLENRQP